MGGLLARTTGRSLKQEPPARAEKTFIGRTALKNENVRPSDTERDGQASMEFLKWECKCIVALATEVCAV